MSNFGGGTCPLCSAAYALGTTPIYAPFDRPRCNFIVSIIKRPPALELLFGGAYIKNYTVYTTRVL